MFGPHVEKTWATPRAAPLAAHVRAAHAAAAAEDFAMGAAGVFLCNPRSGAGLLGGAQLDELRATCGALGVRLLAHAAYCDAPWGAGAARAAERIRQQLAACERAGAQGLVIHLGAVPADRVAATVPELLSRDAPTARLFLETPAVTRHKHYDTPEKLAALCDAVVAAGTPLERIGICVDTAHEWVMDVDVGSAAGGAEFVRGLAAVPAQLAFHLNDSERPRGVGPDAHAALGAGHIWPGAPAQPGGLAPIVQFIRARGLTCVLERHARDGARALAGDYAVLRAIQ